MIKNIKNKFFGRFINSKPYTDTHARSVKTYDQVKTMAFLLDGSDPIALRELLNHLDKYRKDGKKLSFLGYVKKLPPFDQDQIVWLTRKDMNWLGMPKATQIKSFIEKNFDVLINTTLNTIRPLEYVSTYSKAALRIGRFDEKKTYCYDFMMHLDGPASVYDYLSQVDRYLKMVK